MCVLELAVQITNVKQGEFIIFSKLITLISNPFFSFIASIMNSMFLVDLIVNYL